MLNNQKLGRSGEMIAIEYCREIGYKIITRHFTSRYGELDIIAQDGNEVVFIEVKTRRGSQFGHPEESVTKNKLKRIVDTIAVFLEKHKEVFEYRIDVIIIQYQGCGGCYSLRHMKSVENEFGFD